MRLYPEGARYYARAEVSNQLGGTPLRRFDTPASRLKSRIKLLGKPPDISKNELISALRTGARTCFPAGSENPQYSSGF